MKHFPGPWFRVATRIFQNPLALVAGLLLCLAPTAAHAQSVTFAGALSTLPANGLFNPGGVAVDSAGNVFITELIDDDVLESPLTAAGYGPLMILPFNGLGVPEIAVDGAGDVFIADENNHRVVELPKTPTGFGPQTTLPLSCFGSCYPNRIALDGAENVYVNEVVGNDVIELPKTATGYGPQTILPFTVPTFAEGLALDQAGDVFITDIVNDRVRELPRTPTGYGPERTLLTSSMEGWAVAVDSAGDVFITYPNNDLVGELPKTSTGYGPQTILPISGLNLPQGIAVDGAGDVFVTDEGNNRAVELQTVSVNFGGANVCAPGATTPAPCSQTLTLNYNVNADTTLGEPQVATGGLKHLDFNRASGNCVGAVTAGTTCRVEVTFSPLAAGFRHGSVSLPDTSGHDITTTELSGFGIEATTGAPVAQLSTTHMSFGAIDFGATKTFPLFVANIGGGTLTVAPSISGPSYKIANSTCAAGVTPGNSCTLVVEYSPVSIGPHDDTLTVATNGGSPTVGLLGSVVGLSVLGGVSGATLDFGPVTPGDTKMLPLTVTNVGLPGTVMVGTTISGPSFSVLTTGQNTCLAGITAGQSCTLPIEFAPTKSGLHDELLTLTPFPGSGNTTVWLTGSTP